MPTFPEEPVYLQQGCWWTVLVTAASVSLALAPPCRAQERAMNTHTAPTIHAIVVAGLKDIREQVVLDQLDVRVGDPFDDSAIARNVQRLDRLAVFSHIDIAATAEGDGVRLDVTVVETLRVLPAVSVGVTDADGVSVGPTLRLLSFRGIPQEVSVTARFGGSTIFEFKEVSPFLYSRRLWHMLKVNIDDRQNDLDDFGQQSTEVDGQVGSRLSEHSKVGAIFNLYTVGSDVSGKTLSSSNRDWFVGGGAIFEDDSRDLPTSPSRGWWNSVDVLWRGGSGSYLTLNADARRYQPLSTRHGLVAHTLLTLQTGTIGEDVPIYGDYSLGGENTIRGWPFGSRRGKNQFINTLEYRYLMVPPKSFSVFGFNFYAGVAGAVFGDVGATWNEPGEFVDRFIGGGGIGLRLIVPFVSMIRLDLSFGHPSGDALVEAGVNEKFVAQRNRVR